MANFAELVAKPQPMEERIIEFKGLNRNTYVEEGEMSDMKNLTSDNYPLLTPRRLRGELALPASVAKPLKIITKYERIAMIARKTNNDIAFFYSEYNSDGELVFNEISKVTGLRSDTEMVAINTKICFFPQKTYLSLTRGSSSVTIGAFGHLDASTSLSSASVTISNEDVKMTAPSGHNLERDDAVDLSGSLHYTAAYEFDENAEYPYEFDEDAEYPYEYIEGDDEGNAARAKAAKDAAREAAKAAGKEAARQAAIAAATHTTDIVASLVLEAVSGNVLTMPRETFIEITGEGATNVSFTGTIKREVPDIKHVVEWNNRLWGASDDENVIYACKLGDPRNWKYYQGTSLDSYYAQQGTDENFTGSAAYSAHLIFFKPNSMTRIYGTSPSTFQLNNMVCYGVETGSSKSVAIINDTVLYKSSLGIMVYEGDTPYCISDKINCKFKNVVCGTEGRKYYASIQKENGVFELLCLDVDRAVWHKEDDVRFRDCCTLDGRLYFITDVTSGIFERNRIFVINPKEPIELRKQREWMAAFGPFDEYVENQKIYSKMSLRLVVKTDTIVTVYIKMDDGEWERVKQIGYASTSGETIPIVPRRCDRFSIKIVGKGDCEIKSLTRRYRRGSAVKR